MNRPLSAPRMIEEARATGKGHRGFVEVLIFLLVFLVAQSLLSIPVGIASVAWVFSSDAFAEIISEFVETQNFDAYMESIMALVTGGMPDWLMTVQLFSTALTTLTAILFCRWFEKRTPATMGLRKSHAVREYLIGALIGIALISVCVGLCAAFGGLTLSTATFSVGMWLLYLVGFFIQGMSEEVLCRGYLMVSLSRRGSMVAAVLTNSLVFGLLHLVNPGFGLLPLLNITLFGILLSIYVLRRGNLWGACAIHSLWNFFQGNVFGISVSGTGTGASPLSATLDEGLAILNGGTFGIEGGLVVTLVLAVATVLVFFLLPKKPDEHEIAPAAPTDTSVGTDYIASV